MHRAAILLALALPAAALRLPFPRWSRGAGSAPVSAAAPATAAAPAATALLFDCDGVIVETEELHRRAYNGAFAAAGLTVGGAPVEWSVEYYDVLQNTVGGGKPKMRWHFTETCGGAWPDGVAADDAARVKLIDDLQDSKTDKYKSIVSEVAVARPGVLELMDAAIAAPEIRVGICSASTKAGFEKVVDAIVGQDRLAKLDVVIAGDDVDKKKPDPEIYDTAAARLGIAPSACLVIEDSLVGLRAAKAAGMKCLVTYTHSTASVDFYSEGADAAIYDLGGVTLDDLLPGSRVLPVELLEAKRDAPRPAAVAVEYDPNDPRASLRALLRTF